MGHQRAMPLHPRDDRTLFGHLDRSNSPPPPQPFSVVATLFVDQFELSFRCGMVVYMLCTCHLQRLWPHHEALGVTTPYTRNNRVLCLVTLVTCTTHTDTQQPQLEWFGAVLLSMGRPIYSPYCGLIMA
jgi:hypothetical protein